MQKDIHSKHQVGVLSGAIGATNPIPGLHSKVKYSIENSGPFDILRSWDHTCLVGPGGTRPEHHGH